MPSQMISYMHHQKHGVYLPQIAIPTTLSVAECTYLTGYTDEEGNKVGVVAEELAPKVRERPAPGLLRGEIFADAPKSSS